MKIIDCSASIGLDTVNRAIVNHENYPVYERVRQLASAQEMLEEMDFCGVEQTFVYHQSMYDVDPSYGNQRILQEVQKAPQRLKPTWAILPPITEKAFAPETLFPAMRENGVCALRAYPLRNRYMLDAVSMGELLDAMVERAVPLYLSPQDGWEPVFGVLREFPQLTVILTNYGLWGSARYFYPLVRAYKNVYIDTSDYQVVCGLRAFVDRYGADRLLFGSNLPMDGIGGPLAALFGAELRPEDREKIAHENIERIMGGVKL